MTPYEIAGKLPRDLDGRISKLDIAAAISNAIQDEREACANLVESFGDVCESCKGVAEWAMECNLRPNKEIAAAIRARKP